MGNIGKAPLQDKWAERQFVKLQGICERHNRQWFISHMRGTRNSFVLAFAKEYKIDPDWAPTSYSALVRGLMAAAMQKHNCDENGVPVQSQGKLPQ